jgi:hypothetical protein
MLLEKLKTMAGEVKDSDFLSLMLRRPSRGDSPRPSDYFYYDGSQYFTASDDERVVVPTTATPADVIDVEWKRADETFLDYVTRKLSQPSAATAEQPSAATAEQSPEDKAPSSEGALSNEEESQTPVTSEEPKNV